MANFVLMQIRGGLHFVAAYFCVRWKPASWKSVYNSVSIGIKWTEMEFSPPKTHTRFRSILFLWKILNFHNIYTHTQWLLSDLLTKAIILIHLVEFLSCKQSISIFHIPVKSSSAFIIFSIDFYESFTLLRFIVKLSGFTKHYYVNGHEHHWMNIFLYFS